MKFATLALVGAASAKELTELVGKRWRWKHIPALMEQEGRVMRDLEDMKPDLEKAAHEIEDTFEHYIIPRYGPELEAWGRSAVVKAKQAHDKKMMKSELGQQFFESLEHVAEDAQTVHWAAGFDQDGYAEWIKNEDLAMMFEDVYAVKEALKALVESKMAMMNGKLGKATLKNEHFQKIVQMFFEDMGVENWDQLQLKLHKMGMMMAKKMGECKKTQRLFKDLCRLIDMAERTKEIFDMPSKKDVEAWWNAHDFQPWM